jgi:hypothetical protein
MINLGKRSAYLVAGCVAIEKEKKLARQTLATARSSPAMTEKERAVDAKATASEGLKAAILVCENVPGADKYIRESLH